jgi:hypothetical protein
MNTSRKSKPQVPSPELDTTVGALTKEQRDSIRTHGLPNRGLLLKLTAGRFNNKRMDRGATAELCDEKSASAAAVQVNKVLVSKQHLEPVTKHYNRLRDIIRTYCLPWDGTGWVFVPIGVYEKVRAELSLAEADKDRAVDAVAEQWEQVIEEQRAQLGDLFDRNDYPDPDEFRAAWRTNVDVQQVPSTDIRLDMDDDAVRDIANQVHQMVSRNMTGAWSEAVTRLTESLQNVAKILNDQGSDEKRRAPIHDTLLENLRLQCSVVKAMGEAGGDKELLKLATAIEQDLLAFSTEMLRANPALRDRVGQKAAHAAERAGRECLRSSKKVDALMEELKDFG